MKSIPVFLICDYNHSDAHEHLITKRLRVTIVTPILVLALRSENLNELSQKDHQYVAKSVYVVNRTATLKFVEPLPHCLSCHRHNCVFKNA